MVEYNRDQLAHLLRHARAQVPFYAKRLDAVFRSDGSIDWSRWAEIPILTKSFLRDSPAELMAKSLPPGHGPTKKFSTSGSSGVPITITATAIASVVKTAAVGRMHYLHRIDGTQANASFAFTKKHMTIPDVRIGTWSAFPATPQVRGKNLKINLRLPERKKLQIMMAENCRYITELPNTTEILARENLKLRKRLKLDAVVCYGQGVSEDQQALFHKSFGARAISIYSSKEAGLMACQCTAGPHYHVNSELVLLEVLDPQNRPCAPGESGRVVVTPLYSTAQPLIRYEQGDIATVGDSCTCGSQLPVLFRIEGRQDPVFRFPDGYGSEVMIDKTRLNKVLRAQAVQIAQVTELKFEVRYSAKKDVTEKGAAKLTAHLREALHPKLRVAFKRMAELPRNAGGKQQRFVREFA
ncbi:MAG: phenylacetate--CoA ligase family protein [Rhizobiales bacterium]|nr:phenylacetate--CoA ligase family protein [Hyphomicrobiales bacterium]